MQMFDDLYRELMSAGHRSHHIDQYEISDVGRMLDVAEASGPPLERSAQMAVESVLARQQGRKLEPAPVVMTPERREALRIDRRN